MKLGTRIFISCLLVVGICVSFPLYRLADTIVMHYREGVEDILVDEANILAAVLEREIEQGRFTPENWRSLFDSIHNRSFTARIYDFYKVDVDTDIYITDEQGVILLDTENSANAGEDFSKWRDVYLTLQGEYGARTTRHIEADEATSVLYVAAPIRVGGQIAGVLTVVKPTNNIRYFAAGARHNILKSGFISLLAAGLLSLLIAVWLTGPIKRLTRYARGIRDHEHPAFPRLDSSEIGELGKALAEMQETLEGKRYVEQYVENLTHELKSPLSAIRGAAELLAESRREGGQAMNPAQQQRFIANIEAQSLRIQEIVDRMLELAALESRSFQRANETVALSDLVSEACAAKEAELAERVLSLTLDVTPGLTVTGDSFLLRQALLNLIQNAIDFSPERGRITVSLQPGEEAVTLAVSDEGPGIPDYAVDRVFEKFFSLQRPHSGQKSTGLGLNFVRQVALLHNGTASLGNRPCGGARSVIEFPGG